MKSTLLSKCTYCGGDMVAPNWSEHLSDRCVRNAWSCEACGCEFEIRSIYPRGNGLPSSNSLGSFTTLAAICRAYS